MLRRSAVVDSAPETASPRVLFFWPGAVAVRRAESTVVPGVRLQPRASVNTLGRRFEVGQRPVPVLPTPNPSAGDMNLFHRLLRFLFGYEPPARSASQPRPTPAPAPAPEPPTTPDAIAATLTEAFGKTAETTAPALLPDATADPYFAVTADVQSTATNQGKGNGKSSLGLEANAYLPISREEIKKTAKGIDRFGNPWFGRRDLIPPTDDPRTNLIDRAMVTQGLLSPTQLHEIHDVGARMDQIRPSLAAIESRAAVDGAAAVAADREARVLLKARKKAEAAQRKQERIDQVAHRKATDIVFLGRGVSAGLNDRQSDLDALTGAGLPLLSTPADLAAALSLSISKLRWLAFHTEAATRTHYVQFTVPKKSGGLRTLSAPHRTLAEAQRWIFQEIVAKLPVESAAHGFVAGRSIVSNAEAHCRRAVVVNMDLEAFFPSIGFPRVRRVFRKLGYSPAVATILALLTTECPRRTVVYGGTTYHVATGPRGLPQGACTSPGLSNQVAIRLDRRLSGLARKFDLSYTRYADDLTLSGDATLEAKVGYLMARLRHIAGEEGFAVNEAKSRVLRQATAQTVTGLVVNDRPGVRRAEVRRLRAILHRAKSEGLASQNRDGHPNFLAWLHGKIAFVAMARPELGAALRAELDSLL
ncbi:Reverse transcriptase (RNA-dependent DNA polymerase) [Singulisphaera acidiphila DSM 18658]|uniref:RNA-directed DNA polymerase n=2 Tax=Singulisphaera acidiphila TaxID=466153 RepID=L0DH52_SINAD|nr:Reverse transcriptase (RNA-dependent DNA polymerase) [Singulisphaera acidiphila DSM 18658]